MKKLALLFIPALVLTCKSNVDKGRSSNAEQLTEKKIIANAVNSDTNAQTENKVFKNSDKLFVYENKLNVEDLIDSIDFNMDISKLSISEIRLLRNSFAAKQGECFMNADLRAIFATTTWYNERMEYRYWQEDGGNPIKPITYSKQEVDFIQKLLEREIELKLENYRTVDNRKMPNMNNLINPFQLENIDPKLMQMLSKKGFAIVPGNNIQLFHIYEENDYKQFPDFVTTDMYMQLFHMYFGYILRTIENEQFIPRLSAINLSMFNEMNKIIDSQADEPVKTTARFNATFYAIAYTALTNNKLEVPAGYEEFYKTELSNIVGAKDNFSDFLEYTNQTFPYSLFKPRGHYTRTDSLKRYFRSMMWLQTAPFCLDNDRQLKTAILSAWVLANNKSLLNDYYAIMDPISFIIGLPDNVSFLQLANVINENHYELNELLADDETTEKFRAQIKKIADSQNRIKPKIPFSCEDKINFIPQRYLADNEILQELIDTKSQTTLRGYPKGLDVMAAFGSTSAEDILMNELNEGKNWDQYPKILSDLKNKMATIDWNSSVYNKWMEGLLNLQKSNNDYPYFMQTPQWDKKNLNSSLASWAELKHDAILYAEQPMAAECGGGGPPDPYTVAYVEPNVGYWENVIELIDLIQQILTKNNLINSDITRLSERLKENAEFLLNASKKELKGQSLTEEEYRQIEHIGSTFEWITIDLVKDKNQYLDGWYNVKGPDRSVAVVADVFTSNALNNPDPGILHVATGNVNDIFVVVEIDGYLYLTKGAVLGYYEFHIPPGNRLTDEEWQEMLEKNQQPEIPGWIKEIILPIETPKANEKIFYSSGC